MGQAILVEMQIHHAQILVDRLAREGILAAASWVLETDSGQWYLYLVTSLVGEDDDTWLAYQRVLTVVSAMEDEGFWIEALEIKVIGPHDPIAKDLIAHRDARPRKTPMWYRGYRLGELNIEQAYIYPPTPKPEKATEAAKP